MEQAGTITLLTRDGVVTRAMTPTEKRAKTMSRARDRKAQEKRQEKREAAQTWLTSTLEPLGLTLEECEKLGRSPDYPDLVESLSWRKDDDRTRFEGLMRQRLLVDLELSARYWRVGKRLRAKILTACEAP
jgi:hypothetical protein